MHILLEYLLLVLISIYAFLESFVNLFIPAKRKSVKGEIVLISGAGHGIGRLTAIAFAKLQTTLVLWDINKVGVQATAEECRRLGATAHTYQVDCSQREDVYCTADKIKKDVGDVSILVNNAGVVVCTELLNIQDDQIQRTFDVNIMAHFWTLKAFLPAMMKNNHGHIVTVASICGHLPLPQLVDYCSSKFAAAGLHIALTAELASLGKDGIKTSCLCPVFVNTGFVKNPYSRIWPILAPEDVVKELMNGVLTNKKMIFVPPSARFYVLMDRIFPERITDAVNRLQGARCEAPGAHEDKDK